jgi:hypothetical protein
VSTDAGLLIPPPPTDEHGMVSVFSYDIAAALRTGVTGGCVVCRASCVTWWGLAACSISPMTDGSGALTEWLCLHRRCVSTVMQEWAILLHGAPDEGEDDPLVGAQPIASPPPPGAARRPPQGAWAS